MINQPLRMLGCFGAALLLGCAGAETRTPEGRLVGGTSDRRRMSDQVELAYEERIEVWAVTGLPGHFYYDGGLYRHEDDLWFTSNDIEGPWRLVSSSLLPRPLQALDRSWKANIAARRAAEAEAEAKKKGLHREPETR